MSQKWVTVKQACNILSISRTTLYRRIKEDNIETKKDGNNMTMCCINVPNGTNIETTGVPDVTVNSLVQLEQEVKQWQEKAETQEKEENETIE